MTMHVDPAESARNRRGQTPPDLEWTIDRKPEGGERLILWEQDNLESYICINPDAAIDLGAL